ncbi:MAG: hypothetical protein GY822_00265 [Deltaproteobacteria bacterium]|nr:hypothetical protein [Deltaproteobacteria bacterium]
MSCLPGPGIHFHQNAPITKDDFCKQVNAMSINSSRSFRPLSSRAGFHGSFAACNAAGYPSSVKSTFLWCFFACTSSWLRMTVHFSLSSFGEAGFIGGERKVSLDPNDVESVPKGQFLKGVPVGSKGYLAVIDFSNFFDDGAPFWFSMHGGVELHADDKKRNVFLFGEAGLIENERLVGFLKIVASFFRI